MRNPENVQKLAELCFLCTTASENLVFLRGSFFADMPLRRRADTVVLFRCGSAAL
jgi:hypothetical protein